MLTALASLKKKLSRRKYDAILVSQPENRRYLSHYSALDSSISESSGLLLIPRKGTPLLLTDSRFQIQAESESPDYDIILYKKGVFALLETLLPSLNLSNLAFESNYLLHSQFLKLAKICRGKGITLVPTEGLIEQIRIKKTEEEIKKIRQSVSLNEAVFQKIYHDLRPGVREIDVALQIESMMREKGAERPSFETIVASGPNSALPHAVPTHRQIGKGEPVVIDMGLIYDGLCSDMTRTIVLGRPDDFTRKIFRIVRQAQLAAQAALRSGVHCRTVDRAARDIIISNNYGENFGHGLGHGVGLAVHEAPSLNSRNSKKLRCGMVVTIEPGIYIPGWGGVRLENMALVLDSAAEILNCDDTFLDVGIF